MAEPIRDIKARRSTGGLEKKLPAGIEEKPALSPAAVIGPASIELLRSLDLDSSVLNVLGLTGRSMGLSRIYVSENERQADGNLRSLQRYRWDAPGFLPAANLFEISQIDASDDESASRSHLLAGGEPQVVIPGRAHEQLRRRLDSFGIQSMLLAPVFVDRSWWGQVVYADCRSERTWSATEIDTLKTLAELIGAAITHGRVLDELAATARIVENSSTILYRLQPQPPYAITYASRNVKRYGYTRDELLSAPTRYFELVHPDDLPRLIENITRLAAGEGGETVGEYRLRTADGKYVYFEGRTRGLYNHDRRLTSIEGVLVDISERKAAEEKMIRLALTDRLTGMPNRDAFMMRLAKASDAVKRGSPPFAVLYLDLDHFKDINGALGHTRGDELLKLLGNRLRELLRDDDMIARFGGDEFAILVGGVTDRMDAQTLAERVIGAVADCRIPGTEMRTTVSVGISVFDARIAGPEDVIKQADLALYRAKESGRNQYHFHSEELDAEVRDRVTLMEDLRHGIGRGELELYYQPQVEMPSGTIVGMEALVRWNHPAQGMILPERFVPIAEKTDVIVLLGRWVIEQVGRQIHRWREQGLRPPRIALNVSAAQLRPSFGFEAEFAEALRRWDLDPGDVELELTESVLMETVGERSEIIARLRRLGVSIAIDDFGTGYSSLTYLRAFRVSHLKIAQDFIRDLEQNPGDVAIVRATIGLARELGIEVIAEGVETARQLDLVASAGCRYFQGYHFSQPVPAEQAAQLMLQGRLGEAQSRRIGRA